ncbi:MAG: hypothetical protein ACFCUS_06885 [Rubrimonas sp.]|uniref:hypothetical protein n=1 Tax=Rubrimonas sp. TaxID=2036015 RepID=UPI002FDE587A
MRIMKRGGPIAAALVAAAAGLAEGSKATAGAWTRAPGETFLSVSTSTYRTDDGGYEEMFGALYGEYGLREGLTVGGAAELSRPTGPAAALEDRLTWSAFARVKLREGAAGDPLSVQVGASYARQGARAGEPQQRATDGFEFDLRSLYGRGFATSLGDAFYDAQAGLRLRLGDPSDEIRVDLTAGLRPRELDDGRWLALVQSFSVLSLRNGDGDQSEGFDSVKLAASAAREVRDGLHLGVGVERDVAGREIDLGTRIKLFLWSEF